MMQGSLAERLRVLRARQGYTLAEAAEKTGVDRGTLSSLERGVHGAYTPTLHKIAKGYDVPVEDLLEEPTFPALAALVGKAQAPSPSPKEEPGAPPPVTVDLEPLELRAELGPIKAEVLPKVERALRHIGDGEIDAAVEELEGVRKILTAA